MIEEQGAPVDGLVRLHVDRRKVALLGTEILRVVDQPEEELFWRQEPGFKAVLQSEVDAPDLVRVVPPFQEVCADRSRILCEIRRELAVVALGDGFEELRKPG